MNIIQNKKKFNSLIIILMLFVSFQSSIYDVRENNKEKNEDDIDSDLQTDYITDEDGFSYNPDHFVDTTNIPQSSEYLASDAQVTTTSTGTTKFKELTTTKALTSIGYYWQGRSTTPSGSSTYLYINGVSKVGMNTITNTYTVKSGTWTESWPAGTKLQMYMRSWTGGYTAYGRYFRMTTVEAPPGPPTNVRTVSEPSYDGKVRFGYTVPVGYGTITTGYIYVDDESSFSTSGYQVLTDFSGDGLFTFTDDTSAGQNFEPPLLAGTYYARMRFWNSVGVGSYCSTISFEVSDPETPENLIEEENPCYDGTNTITWDEPIPNIEGLVGRWDMNGNAQDFLGIHDGTVSGAVLTTDRFGNTDSAYYFDGINDYIDIPNYLKVDSVDTGITISAWVNLGASSANYDRIFSFGTTTSNYQYPDIAMAIDGSLKFYTYHLTGGWYDSGINLALDTWTHITYTFEESGAVNAYVNGNHVYYVALSSGTFTNLYLTIGNRGDLNNEACNGKIDDVRFYDRKLESSEILALMGNEISNDESSITAHWDFDGDALDLVGSNDGSVSGAILTTDRFGDSNTAYDFDGSNDRIQISSPVVATGQDEYSISAWFYWGGGGGGTDGRRFIFEAYPNYVISLCVSTGSTPHLQAYSHTTGGGPTAVGSTVIVANIWYFATITYKEATTDGLRLYLNGKLDGKGTTTGTLSASSGLYIGTYRSANNRWFDGKIDDVKIFDEVISDKTREDMYFKNAHWKFDGNVEDSIGNNDGTNNGPATLTTDRFGNTDSAYDFDGNNDYIYIPFGAGINTGTTSFSLSMWVKSDLPSTALMYASFGSSGTNTRAYFGHYGSDWDMGVQSNGWNQAGSDTTATTDWTHIGIVFNSETLIATLYVNGDFSLSKSFAAYTFPSGANLRIGCFGDISYDWNGKIDDVRLYNYALSNSDIERDYVITYTLYEATAFDGSYNSIEIDIQSSIYTSSTIITETENGTLYYKIKAISSVGSSDYSDYASIDWLFPDTPTLSDPTTHIEYNHDSFSVSRGVVEAYVDEFDWEISIDEGAFGDWSSSSDLTVSYDPSAEEHEYQFRLRVRYSDGGIWSDYGYSGNLTTSLPEDPGAPNCDSPDFDGNITITWSAGVGSDSAILQISTDEIHFEDILGAISSPTTILDLEEGSYWFKVNSTNTIGSSNSTYSSEIIVSNPAPVIAFINGYDIEHSANVDLNFTITDITTKPILYYNLTYSYNGGSNISIWNNYIWTTGIEISYNVNESLYGTNLGNYTFFVITNDNVDHLNKTSIENFTIEIVNTEYPYFMNLVYNNFEFNTSGQEFTWDIIDSSILNPYYKIEYSKDGGALQTAVASQSWISGVQNSLNLDFIKETFGSYNFTITAYDGFTKSNFTSFYINITNLVLPTFVNLTYTDFEYFDTGYEISFILTDVSMNFSENYYKIEYSKDGGFIQIAVAWSDWINNSINTLDLDFISESLGYYEFNITAYDGLSDSNSSIFNINITNYIMPIFVDLTYTDFEFKHTGYSTSWINTDFSFNGSRYYKVEYAKSGDSSSVLIASQFWNNNSINSFSVDFINGVIGIYEFNITTYDGLGGSSLETFYIEILNEIAPIIVGISSFTTAEYSSDVILIWFIYDISSENQYYTLNRTIDSVEYTLLNESWINQDFTQDGRNSFYFVDYSFQFDIELYNFTLYVFDGVGLSINITFYVNITDSLIPEIIFSNTIHIIETNEEFELEWLIEDESIDSDFATYDLDYKKNNNSVQNIRDDIEWLSGDIFSFQITDLGFMNETYNITFYIIAFDGLSLSFNSSFFLFISNGISIIVCNVSDASIEYDDDTDFNVIVYDISINITSIIVSYIFEEDYTELLNTTWISGEEFEFVNLNFSLGIYDFTINVSDGNEYVNETFTYNITNIIAPTITLDDYDSIIYRDNIIDYITQLKWSITDVSESGGTYNFYYEIDGDRTNIISNEEFVSDYSYDLILNNLTDEVQEISFTIIAKDGLGLSSIERFTILIEIEESIIIKEDNQLFGILFIIGGTIGLAIIINILFKKKEK